MGMIDGMVQNIQEILKWKKELEKEKLEEEIDSYIKTETIVEEDDDEDIEMETENEIEDTIDSQDEMEIIPRKTLTTQNENLRFEWYKFSARFVTEEYKFKYVQPNAEVTNREKVFEWYEKCDNMGLVPDEFKLIPIEDEPEEPNNPSNRKSFHRQRKEEWKKRKASKNVFIVIEDKKEKENKKENVFSKTRTRPPSLKFTLSTMLA